MILSISVALLIAGALLLLLKDTGIPEIPVYVVSGLLLSVFSNIASSQGLIPATFVESEIMRELALLGLGILVFYSTSSLVLDVKRSTTLSSFKTVLWLSTVSFAGFVGLSLTFGLNIYESVLFGVAAATGSTLMDSGLVKEEARKNHIYGWLT
ncbi:MAG: hypothetical protein BRC26_01465, partial [Nanohaloarchaea archaeon QH_8_44_6]